MKAQIFGMDGKAAGEVELPALFAQEVRLGLIARAAIADQTHSYQPKGNDVWAGMRTSARYRGRKEDFGSIKNHGISRLPREVLSNGRFGKVRLVPSSVKGRRAHPPRVEKRLIERINRKEYAKALGSALAATANNGVVSARGHKISAAMKLPFVFDESVENATKTKQIAKMFETLGIQGDIDRARITRHRSGIGARKGGVRRAKSLLVVVGKECGLSKAARNIAGVDVVEASKLRVLDLAPGAKAGRLAAFTKGAIEALSHRVQ